MSTASSPVHATWSATPIERRERRPVSMRGFALRGDGAAIEVLLLDLSYDGCGIETSAELHAGENLQLSVLERGGIDATVRWCRDGKAGLVFAAAAADEPEQPQHPRIAERTAISADVAMRRLGHANYRVQVFDLSPNGCKIELMETPRIGEHVLIRFDGLEVMDAEVCWVEGRTAGARFEKPFHPAVFVLLVARLQGG